ncbi:MAG: ParB/RepB/Spo0J family partition protein [Hyphomicrobiales bacterium]|nr:ParB/RepB/Spo0J family partition protein [Hyphomicrobiales bacterium]
MNQQPQRRLGRGLAALIGDDVPEETVVQDIRHLRHMPIESLVGSPNNPRKQFGEEELGDLAKSISDKGLLQPIVVRPRGDGSTYEIVAGERRWRAAQRAGIHDVPVLIRELDDGEALEVALIENIQRTDLNPLEESGAYAQLIEQFSYTQQQLADAIGKSRSHVANSLRLLNLPEKVRGLIAEGLLSAGHARTLVATDAPGELAEKIISLGLSVREAEQLTRDQNETPERKASKPSQKQKSADVRSLENQLSQSTGFKIEISDKGRAGGKISISYKSLEQLDDICMRLGKKA